MFISKRMLWLVGAIVVLVMLAAGVGVAYAFNALTQQKTTAANLSATVTAQAAIATPALTAQAKNGQRRVTGVIQALNAQAFTLEVATKKAKRALTVDVTSQTTYAQAGKVVAFSDLTVGETVVVLGTLDVKSLSMEATRVMISPKPVTPQITPTPTP